MDYLLDFSRVHGERYKVKLPVEVITPEGKRYWFESKKHAVDILTRYKEDIENCRVKILS